MLQHQPKERKDIVTISDLGSEQSIWEDDKQPLKQLEFDQQHFY